MEEELEERVRRRSRSAKRWTTVVICSQRSRARSYRHRTRCWSSVCESVDVFPSDFFGWNRIPLSECRVYPNESFAWAEKRLAYREMRVCRKRNRRGLITYETFRSFSQMRESPRSAIIASGGFSRFCIDERALKGIEGRSLARAKSGVGARENWILVAREGVVTNIPTVFASLRHSRTMNLSCNKGGDS